MLNALNNLMHAMLFADDLSAVIGKISTALHTIDRKMDQQIREIRSFRDQLEENQINLKRDVTSRLNTLDAQFSQYKEQITTELTNFKMAVNSTNTRLESLTSTIDQLSSDHQEIQENISSVQCSNTGDTDLTSSSLHNITQMVEKIEEDVSFIREEHSCGSHGWRLAVYLDLSDNSTDCPSGWNETTRDGIRTCGKMNSINSTVCDSVNFTVNGGPYNRVCGRIRGYQFNGLDAFRSFTKGNAQTIDDVYVSGVSLTHGDPRVHIWTFAAGMSEDSEDSYDDFCPCDVNGTRTINVPDFVGDNYFCESGANLELPEVNFFNPNDPLWDGEGCTSTSTCCSLNDPPYFIRNLPSPTTDSIEARLCWLEVNDDIPIELIELYVQ